MRRKDVDFANGLAVAMDKGSVQRRVAFSPTATRALLRHDRAERNQQCGHLFQNRSGAPRPETGFRMPCNRIALATGLHVNPHALRRAAATMHASGGAGAGQIQQLLGHDEIGIPVRHVHLDAGALVEANRRHAAVERAKQG